MQFTCRPTLKNLILTAVFATGGGFFLLFAYWTIGLFILLGSSDRKELIDTCLSPSGEYSALVIAESSATVAESLRVRVVHAASGDVLDDVGRFMKPVDQFGRHGLTLSWTSDDTLDISYAAIDRQNIEKTELRHGGKTITVTINSAR